jgi:hypothetical protein
MWKAVPLVKQVKITAVAAWDTGSGKTEVGQADSKPETL